MITLMHFLKEDYSATELKVYQKIVGWNRKINFTSLSNATELWQNKLKEYNCYQTFFKHVKQIETFTLRSDCHELSGVEI